MIIIPSDYFTVKDYKRHIETGHLQKGIMVHCKGDSDMQRIRSNVYQYARTRGHLTYTEKQDSKNLLVRLTGNLKV